MESKTLDDVLGFLKNELGGDWLLAGGSLVRLEFDGARGTEDIDLMRVSHPTLSDEAAKHRLFNWLIAKGLGPEWVNSTMDPFVREVPDWETELVTVSEGSHGRILRPNLTLFAYLKIRRGSEIDLDDVKKAAARCPEGFDEAKFLDWANPTMKTKYQSFRSRLGL